jgi:hypothetical protein
LPLRPNGFSQIFPATVLKTHYINGKGFALPPSGGDHVTFKYVLALSALCGMFNSVQAHGGSGAADSYTYQYLLEFHRNPRRAMERLPDEVVNGKVIRRGYVNYKSLEPAFAERMAVRDGIIGHSDVDFQPLAPIGEKDRPEALADNPVLVTNLYTIENRGLTRAQVPVVPWTDSYWPIQKGLIGIRYADPAFPDSKDWNANYQYVLANPAYAIASSGNEMAIDNLSPAEKYDLLVGDDAMTLTGHSWAAGKKFYDKEGAVPKWMGICHGWAAAAHMLMPVIREPLTLYSPRGLRLKFYQSDFKALMSMLWANASPMSRFIGSRCKSLNPERNRIGRVIDPTCFDPNPATFHLSLVNQIGANKRSYVMDTTYDLEVWNFSAIGYKYTYFNPQSLQPTTDPRQAVVPVELYRLDKFREFRSPETRYVIGVVMDATHVNATKPTHKEITEAPTKTLRYLYDLELDRDYNIIGGEWYTVAHPDFLWTYPREARPSSRGDKLIDPNEWFDLRNPVPVTWGQASQKAAAAGAPLAAVLNRIIEATGNNPGGR